MTIRAELVANLNKMFKENLMPGNSTRRVGSELLAAVDSFTSSKGGTQISAYTSLGYLGYYVDPTLISGVRILIQVFF